MKTYFSEEVAVKDKIYKAVYAGEELLETFDMNNRAWMKEHDDYLKMLRKLGYKPEKGNEK